MIEDKSQEVKQDEEKQPAEKVRELLGQIAGHPSQEQIDAWKAEFNGELYVMAFSETELYIWRPLSRQEYIQCQTAAQEGQLGQFQYEELVCDTCLLWPANVRWVEKKAGSPVTLFEQIMLQSNFIAPAAASMLVAKL